MSAAVIVFGASSSVPADASTPLLTDPAGDGWGAGVVAAAPLSDERLDVVAGDVMYDAAAEALVFSIDVTDMEGARSPIPHTTDLSGYESFEWHLSFTHAGYNYGVVALRETDSVLEYETQYTCFSFEMEDPDAFPDGRSTAYVCSYTEALSDRITYRISLADLARMLASAGQPPFAVGDTLANFDLRSVRSSDTVDRLLPNDATFTIG